MEPKAKSTAERINAWRSVLAKPRSRVRVLKENDAESPREKRNAGTTKSGRVSPPAGACLNHAGNGRENSGDVDRDHDKNGQSPQVIQSFPTLPGIRLVVLFVGVLDGRHV